MLLPLMLSGEASKIRIDTMGLTENLLIGTAAIVGVYATYEKYFSKAAVRKRRQRRKDRRTIRRQLNEAKEYLEESTEGLTQEVQLLGTILRADQAVLQGKGVARRNH